MLNSLGRECEHCVRLTYTTVHIWESQDQVWKLSLSYSSLSLSTPPPCLAGPTRLMPLQVRILSEHATILTKGTPESAGDDLYSAVHIVIPQQDKVLVPTDVSLMGLPSTYGRIPDRSFLAWKHSLQVRGGVIDRDYRGNIQVILFNNGSSPYVVFKGNIIAQIIIEYSVPTCLTVVQDLPTSTRGTGGFGSYTIFDLLTILILWWRRQASGCLIPPPHPCPILTPDLTRAICLSHTIIYTSNHIAHECGWLRGAWLQSKHESSCIF